MVGKYVDNVGNFICYRVKAGLYMVSTRNRRMLTLTPLQCICDTCQWWYVISRPILLLLKTPNNSISLYSSESLLFELLIDFILAFQGSKDVIYPHLGQFIEGKSSRREISYYQWVTFFLLIEALIVYLPRQIWHQLTQSQCLPFDFTNLRRREDWEDKKNFLVWHMKQTRGNHEYWLWQYLLTELLAIALMTGFFVLTDVFLGGDFYNYGLDWLNYMHNSTNATISPMTARFPRLTICKLQYHSRGGTINSYYPLCLLPINCFNDKIFLFMYFWYAMLFALSFLRGMYMMVLLTCKPARRLRLKLSAKLVPDDTLERFINSHNISDWFILCNLAPIMDPVLIAELVTQLVYDLTGDGSDSKQSRMGKQEKTLQSLNYI